ncbi:alpha-amylase family glycosyl hydrolase [Granulicella sp. dw_53]|uniref:alpha-amylase family glycosyl hydrolase n=1 Tax=Granulicella sp. dw_53 TaxID=2719792 RepID=UPI001BD47815|nr:alpha-amylase family glycosyl hydrolase [Granulicella sp. dw_53]
MELHISRALRQKLDVDDLLFSYTGNVVFGNVAASRKLAQKMNDARPAGADPTKVVNAGALFAVGLIDELNHALVARYRRDIDPSVLTEAVRWFERQSEPAKMERLLLTFTEQFPNVAVYRGEVSAAEWLKGVTDGLPNREAALEELMLLWLANSNPAFAPFRELFEDTGLQKETIYQTVTSALPDYFATRPPVDPEVGSLLDALRAPFLASPDSLTGQLDYIRVQWTKLLGQDLRRVLLAVDVLREEDLAIWMRFHPPGPDWHRHGAPGWGGEGFVGDEFVGFDEDFAREGEGEFFIGPDGVRHRRYAADYQAPLNEYEAFTQDQAWMPNVVLIAKSTYVWLEQLSKKYQRHIHRLDQIPDEELKLLASRGMTGLWLIGLWERSTASRTIKRLRGDNDAVASAYSLKDYDIAEDLGGYGAYEHLRDRAAACGIRLASDMVPNHVGIDATWVIEHPDWFLSRWECPFPVYRFEGPDLSTDSRVEIKIEDHYYDQTDAAVVFRLRHHREQTTRYVYHGNDGTTFAWNDTAQLDYSKADVREHIIQTILHVARMFPIIRFDAAMVLAKRHVQRLWFPLPGAGGSIPSRAENAMTQEEFDALMPNEFWREVVDRVAVEVPGTLLLAEAFWLLEGYFVRTLGMHRVYNSAFMNMLRDEENAKYRSYLKKTIEFDPDILKRYVSFMSNPDERTAIDQFGSGDKYFGVSTLLATLPGLPMFGHGQVEGYTERYGMEFKRARMDEYPNEGLVARHQHEIAPLLKNRKLFAESHHFAMYDFWTEGGAVDENVFAYSNRLGNERAVIVYNNSYGGTRGTIHGSAAYMDKGSGELRQKGLADALALAGEESMVVAYRDTARGLEYLRRATEFHQHGLSLELRGYQYVVLLNWRELRSTTLQPWDRLCDALNGAGVYSVEEALSKLRLRPLHGALREAMSAGNIEAFAEVAQKFAEGEVSVEAASSPEVIEAKEVSVLEEPAPAESEATVKESAELDSVTVPLALDSRLQSFVDQSRHFFETLVDSFAEDVREAGVDLSALSLPVKGRKTLVAPKAEALVSSPPKPIAKVEPAVVADPKRLYAERCEELTAAAVRITELSKDFSTAWPASVSYVLPGYEPSIRQESTWAPAIAWIALDSIPKQVDRVAIFDRLQLRSALAEVFTSFGFEGEGTWRAAAKVRVLLAQPIDSTKPPLHDKEFWNDPDVRWLTGVNVSGDRTYLNKESFEELLVWLQLPALLEIASDDSDRAELVRAMEILMAAECAAVQAAGYDLDIYLNGWNTPKPIEALKTGRMDEAPTQDKKTVSR